MGSAGIWKGPGAHPSSHFPLQTGGMGGGLTSSRAQHVYLNLICVSVWLPACLSSHAHNTGLCIYKGGFGRFV